MHKPNTLAASPSMHCCLHPLLSLQTQTIETTNTTGKLSQIQLTRFHNNLTNRDLAARGNLREKNYHNVKSKYKTVFCRVHSKLIVVNCRYRLVALDRFGLSNKWQIGS
ncbi:Uncharacterized protein APZ42_018120 [Daphnia magna]|uniref:Uncharacterized protein n=1 Tax=Daphnia magna TaxID=35525 RepID=A0A0N8DTH9_9CRUS|nr:Uncharacterized protein APZ42_018120 [Daphnia magna]